MLYTTRRCVLRRVSGVMYRAYLGCCAMIYTFWGKVIALQVESLIW